MNNFAAFITIIPAPLVHWFSGRPTSEIKRARSEIKRMISGALIQRQNNK